MPSFAEKLATLRQEAPERYSSFTLSLAAARANVEFPIAGSYFYIHDGTDSAATITVRFNELRNNPLPVVRGEGYKLPFYRMFITNTAQAGKSVTVVIGVEEPGDFEILQNRFSVDALVENTLATSLWVKNDGTTSLYVRDRFYAVGQNGVAVAAAPAAGTILATTGALATARIFRVQYSWSIQDADGNAGLYLEHRNAADTDYVNRTYLCGSGAHGGGSGHGEHFFNISANQRIRIVVAHNTNTYGIIGALLTWEETAA